MFNIYSYLFGAQSNPSTRENSSHEGQALRSQPNGDSTSVNIEDIIENYDNSSQRSRSTSILSNLTERARAPQTYFTISDIKDDETSFYSALHDGFTLEDEQVSASETNAFNQDAQWSREKKMSTRCDFQVNWSDINYRIRPSIALANLWFRFEKNVRSTLANARDVAACHSRRVHRINPRNAKPGLISREPITILQHVSGSFKSGELTAIIGPSGAGKTSLLNFLSRRNEDGFTGQLYLSDLDHRICTHSIPQDDRLPEYLTVRENLLFASRLNNTDSKCNHESNIETVIDALGLSDCLDTRARDISGGQLKRLSIGQELLSKPDILILDEPTSGLDSLTCFKTLTVLKNLVKLSCKKQTDPIAIVLTIHQPQHEVFDLFDKVYVMATEGRVIYDGPPGECISYVKRHTGIIMPDQDYNPASFLIDIASGEYGQDHINTLAKQVRADFDRSKAKSDSGPLFKAFKLKTKASGEQGDDLVAQQTRMRIRNTCYIDHRIAKASSMNDLAFWRKTGILTQRCWISIIRDPKQLAARIIFHILLPIILGLMLGKEPGEANACPNFKPEISLKDLVKDNASTSSDVHAEYVATLENIGSLFILTYGLVSANIAATTLTFTLDIQNSLKEYYNGWYTMPSYLVARLATNAPMDFLLPAITVPLAYFFTGQYTGNNADKMSDVHRILLSSLAVSFGTMTGQVIGMIFGAIYIGHVITALFASQGSILPLVMMSGLIVRVKDMHKFVKYLSFGSFFRHVADLMFLLRWGFNVCTCNGKSFVNKTVTITGVKDELKSFVRYWMSNSATDEDTTQAMISQNSTSNATIVSANDNEELDLFQTIGKQVSLYNTYGMELDSCEDVRPFPLVDFQIKEKDLVPRFAILMGLWASSIILLMITVKTVVRFRTSL